MRRTFLIGLAALALLLVGSLATILGTPREMTSWSEPPVGGAPSPGPSWWAGPLPGSPETPRVEAGGDLPAVASEAPVPEVGRRLARHRLPRGSPAPTDFFAGLRALAAQVDHCSRHAGSPAAGPPSRTVLLLEFETEEGKVSIVDVQLQRRGAVDEQAFLCARGELLGREIPVSVAHAGMAFQVPLPLQP